MADTRSFFERLTGSVRIPDQDDANGADADPSVGLVAETVTERPAERKGMPGRRKKVIEYEEEPAEASSGSAFSRAAADAASSYPVAAPEPVAEESARDDHEPEGQLTVDIYDDGDSIVIQSTVAGVSPEDLDLSVTSDMVTLKGKRKKGQNVREESYYYKELYWGSFSRSVILPEEVEADEAEAALKNGLLTVRLPKKNKHMLKKIKVKTV